jgi:hypothetical protein
VSSSAGRLAAPSPQVPATQSAGSAGATRALSLPANGRKVIQSAILALSTGPRQIDTVAQEVFGVIGAAGGIVDRSSVTQTGGLDGMASFDLRVPSGGLETTLARLSNLRGATVVSRTDNSEDVNSSYVSRQRALTDARALRAALLKQLAAAQTTAAIDRLHARLATVEATIAADEAALRALTARIDFSRVTVTISATQPAPPPPVHHAAGGFGIGRAAHLAGRVLVVAAGVGLIGLAGLVPVALVLAAVLWAAAAVRRRRREQALDLA